MSTEASKVETVEEVAKVEEVAAPTEPVAEASSAEPAKVEEEAKEATPAAKSDETAVEGSPKEAEKATEGEAKERNGPLKVLAANIKRTLATPKKGDKKEESDAEKEEPTSPSSKEKVLDKLVGIFKKDECTCCKQHAAIEDKPSSGEGEAAAAAATSGEVPAPTAEEAAKPAEETKEEKKDDKSKTTQIYGQIVKVLSPRKSSWKESEASSFENKAETPSTETKETPAAAAEDTPAVVESASSDKAKKEGEAEPTSPGMLTSIKKKAAEFVHSLEEKVHKDKETKAKEEVKAEEKKTEQPTEEVVAAAATEEPAAVAETPVEQEQAKKEKKDVVGNFVNGVKAKIQEVLSKDQEAKDAGKAKEEPVAAEATPVTEKAIETSQANGDKTKEVLTVNELKYEDESKKKEEKAADAEASTQEQTSQKWKNRVSGLFKTKKSTAAEERAETSAEAAATSTPAPEAAPVVASKETIETMEAAPATTTEGEAKDNDIRLAQLYMQTPAAEEAVKAEEKKIEDVAAVETAAVEAPAVAA